MKNVIAFLSILLLPQCAQVPEAMNRTPASLQGDYLSIKEEKFEKYPNYMIIDVVNTDKPVSWDGTPFRLIKSLLENFYFSSYSGTKNRPLGHATVELKCTAKYKGLRSVHRRMGGQTIKGEGSMMKRLREGSGFSVLIGPHTTDDPILQKMAVTVPGHFETAAELVPEYAEKIHYPNLMGFLAVILSEEDCLEMLSFFDRYKAKTIESAVQDARLPAAAGNVYGFGADPAQLEGAGCITFVGAMLKRLNLSGLYDKIMKKVHVPRKLFGTEKYPVSLFSMIFNGKDLSKKYSDDVTTSIPSPHLLYALTRDPTAFDVPFLLETGRFGQSEAYYTIINTAK